MFDLNALTQSVAEHGTVARVVIAAHAGSSPREVGAAMLVWQGGQSGTIGGGALEWQAAASARAGLAEGAKAPHLTQHALGPALGQCCGGAVTLLTETFTAATLPIPQAGLIARPCPPNAQASQSAPPLAVARAFAQARGAGERGAPRMVQGWFLEPLATPRRHLWIWGAGHVGRALVSVLHPLPDLAITWVDTGLDRFPEGPLPANVQVLPAANPADAVTLAPQDAEHLILTYSHALDLDLCHRLLTHGFLACGLIGSATKWARFRSRLAALGHDATQIAKIDCPIGDPSLGKHPQAIAIGVAVAMLHRAKSRHLVGAGHRMERPVDRRQHHD